MLTMNDLRKGVAKQFIKAVFAAEMGDGKTHLAGTFPKSLWAITAPGETDTITSNPTLAANFVGCEVFCPTNLENAASVIARLKKFMVEEVRPKAESGEIETFVLDTATYLVQHFKAKIKESGICVGPKAMYILYGTLKDELMDFFLKYVITLPCNVVINTHLMVEDDEVLAKKKQEAVPYNLSLEGSFRDVLPGMVSYVFYLSKEYSAETKKYAYLVRTNLGAGKRAKSRLMLPRIITGASYTAIHRAIKKAHEASAVAEKIVDQVAKGEK